MTPERYPRRVLLAVAGLAPQVVTETLYALAVARRPPFVPTEVRVITTAAGARRVAETLLARGWLARLCRAYGLAGIRFDESAIAVIADRDGGPLEDVRSASDSLAAADRIAAEVRALTADPDCALHASLAGGRKTLGFYAGYAVSLFGRPQDRLSHVLVAPHLEADPGFFFPEPVAGAAPVPDPVSLCEIPFVRLRDGLPTPLMEGALGFGEAVAAAQAALGPAELVIDLAQARLQAAGRTLTLAPIDLAFLAWMARLAERGAAPIAAPSEDGDAAPAAAFLAEYERIGGARPELARTRRALRRGMDRAYFETRKSRLNAALERALGPAAEPYRIRRSGRRLASRYGLGPVRVRFASIAEPPP